MTVAGVTQTPAGASRNPNMGLPTLFKIWTGWYRTSNNGKEMKSSARYDCPDERYFKGKVVVKEIWNLRIERGHNVACIIYLTLVIWRRVRMLWLTVTPLELAAAAVVRLQIQPSPAHATPQ
jgi:hypothetical protein